MKKILIKYYAVIMEILFLIYNQLLHGIKINGLLYHIFMFVLIIINSIMLIKYGKEIKFKEFISIMYIFIWSMCKNMLQGIFGITSMLILIYTKIIETKFNKEILLILFFTIVVFFLIPISFIYFLFGFGLDINEENELNGIYEDMHYYCDNNYEVYSYSGGAMDSFHYSIGKHYEFLNIDDIIYISYNERNEVSKEEYDNYLNTHKCKLVGDVNESK